MCPQTSLALDLARPFKVEPKACRSRRCRSRRFGVNQHWRGLANNIPYRGYRHSDGERCCGSTLKETWQAQSNSNIFCGAWVPAGSTLKETCQAQSNTHRFWAAWATAGSTLEGKKTSPMHITVVGIHACRSAMERDGKKRYNTRGTQSRTEPGAKTVTPEVFECCPMGEAYRSVS